jgi:class 3 adenylate cyclase
MPDDPEKPSGQSLVRKLATILSADVAGFSRLMGEDEEGTLKTFRGHKQIFESLVAGHRGRIFNTAGDAILAEFGSAVEAVRCATDIQAALRTRNDQLPPNRQVRFRIGINLGDVMLHGQDLLGDGVNVAARLQTAAEPGGICISGSVHDQISNKLSLSFLSLGEMNFKNIQVPVRTFSITHAQGHGDLPSPKAPGSGGRAKWIAAGVLLVAALASGSYLVYTSHERSKGEQASAGAAPTSTSTPTPASPQATPQPVPAVVTPAQAPAQSPAQAPPSTAPETKTALAPPAGVPASKPAEAAHSASSKPHGDSQGSAATSAAGLGRFDGAYSGPICFGQTRKLPERCFQAKGTIRGGKISGRWMMGREEKSAVSLTGDVAKSGDFKIEIVMRSEEEDERLATIDLTGTLRGGLMNATGSFKRGRPATLSWHKNASSND